MPDPVTTSSNSTARPEGERTPEETAALEEQLLMAVMLPEMLKESLKPEQ